MGHWGCWFIRFVSGFIRLVLRGHSSLRVEPWSCTVAGQAPYGCTQALQGFTGLHSPATIHKHDMYPNCPILTLKSLKALILETSYKAKVLYYLGT